MVDSNVLKFGEFTLKSGRKSPFFMNAGAYVTGSQLRKLGEYYARAIHDTFGLEFDVLFGPAYKGIPLAVATSIAISELYGREIRYCSNRKEIKDHGDKGILLGSPLKDGDRVMISEGCTHRRMCGDIGTVKIPRALKKISGSTLEYVFSSGGSFGRIDDLKKVSCVVHCGGCMLSEKEMKRRYKLCERAGVPITNYGLVLAAAGGILDRSIDFIPYE